MSQARFFLTDSFDQYTSKTKKPLKISLALAAVMTLIATIFYFGAQPELPIHYSLLQKQQQLVPKYWLAVFPVFGFSVTLLHAGVLHFQRKSEEFVHTLFAWAGVGANVIVLLILLRLLYATV